MAKKETKNKEPSKKWEHYTVSGDKLERKKSCPKCGPGIFLAEHKDRFYCGSCSYTEFKGKAKEESPKEKKEAPKEEKKPEAKPETPNAEEKPAEEKKE